MAQWDRQSNDETISLSIQRNTSGAFTLAIVGAYIFSLFSGTLILVNGMANSAIALGHIMPGPGMMPLMMGMPLGGGMMFPMMGFSSSVLWASLSGVIIGPIILTATVLLYIKSRQQMVWGGIIVAGAIVGLLSGGGFLVGSLLGFVGGIIAITIKIG